MYILLRKRFKNQSISIAIASICATLINTIGVLGLTYVFYLERYSAILKINPQTAGIAIATIGLTNGVPEAIVSAVISVPVIVAIFRIKKKI